jgi:hypothetical protein
MQQVHADEITPNVSTVQNKKYKRSMTLDAYKDKKRYNPAHFPKEYLTDINETPPFYLELHIGCLVILLATINSKEGLEKGTKLIITGFPTKTGFRANDILKAAIVGGDRHGNKVVLCRQRFFRTEITYGLTVTSQTQFPIRLANESEKLDPDYLKIQRTFPHFGDLQDALLRGEPLPSLLSDNSATNTLEETVPAKLCNAEKPSDDRQNELTQETLPSQLCTARAGSSSDDRQDALAQETVPAQVCTVTAGYHYQSLRQQGFAKFYSDDKLTKNKHVRHIPISFLNTLTSDTIPPHVLELKHGTQVVLLHNIDPEKGLTIGTTLVIKGYIRAEKNHYEKDIEAEIVSEMHRGDKVLLSKIDFITSEGDFPFIFKRRQFPIRLA